MIVVDVNVVAYYFIEGDKTSLARRLMQRDADWRLPALWRHEYLNVLASYARRGGAALAEARLLWRRALGLLGRREEPTDSEQALALAINNHAVSAYDAQYVALARRLGCPLVTDDQRLLRTFPETARNLRAILSE